MWCIEGEFTSPFSYQPKRVPTLKILGTFGIVSYWAGDSLIIINFNTKGVTVIRGSSLWMYYKGGTGFFFNRYWNEFSLIWIEPNFLGIMQLVLKL